MMKKYFYTVIILTTLSSCIESKKNKVQEESPVVSEPAFEPEKLDLNKKSNAILAKWVDYYQKNEPKFSLTDFDLQSTKSLKLIKGSALGNFDENYDTIYDDFLVYNSDRKQYVDFDSYGWFIDERGKPEFSTDQEINWVDIEKKTVKRIAFRGPSQWVEDAFWQNDSVIVLLENGYDKQPIITKLNLKSKSIQSFTYKDTLRFESDYTTFRFKQKGFE